MLKFITGNRQKFSEVQKLLYPFKIKQLDVSLDEIQEIDPKKIIKHKLKEAFKHHQGPFIIEDDSVTFKALGGKLPGPMIKWFNDYLGTYGMYKLCKKMGERNAWANALIVFAKNAKHIKFFEGKIKGKIVAPKGAYKFGYDEIFMPDGARETFSQMKAKGDFRKSPRGLAVERLKKYLNLNLR